MIFFAFYAVASLASLVFSVDTTTSKNKLGYLTCTCTPVNLKAKRTPAFAVIHSGLTALNAHNTLKPGYIGEDTFSVRLAAEKMLNECKRKYSLEACLEADAAMRGKHKTSLCTYEISTGRNVGKTVEKLPSCKPVVFTAVKGKKQSVNEGCVAVEHLNGLQLQYRYPTKRNVLCLEGFCATPNHGIFYRGIYTSMKKLCRMPEMSCANDVRFVNNLRVFVHKRVRVNELIEITPYDERFPFIIAYVIQGIQEIIWLFFLSTAFVILAVIAWAFHQVIQKS